MLDLRRLRILQEVAAHGSFSAAALELGYTQSAVSHHVASLERELGLTLVDRATRPVRLTAAGEALERHGRVIAGHVAQAEAELRAIAGLGAGVLRVGGFMSACMTFLPGAVVRFQREHPGVAVEVLQREPPVARAALLAGELDMAVTFEFAQSPFPADERIERARLFDDGYVLILPSTHPLARRRRLGLADLAGESWHLPPEGHFRETAIALFRAAGFEPHAPFETSDVFVAQSFVASGLGVAMVPRMALLSPRAGMAVIDLDDAPAARVVWAERRGGHRLPSIDAMLRVLEGAEAMLPR